MITKLPWLKEILLKMLDESEVNKFNRFIYMTLIDIAKAECDKDTAIKYLQLLKKIDRLRENFYQWSINILQSH